MIAAMRGRLLRAFKSVVKGSGCRSASCRSATESQRRQWAVQAVSVVPQYSSASHPIHDALGELSEDIVDDAWDRTRRVDVDANGKIFPGKVVAQYQPPLGRIETWLIRSPV